MSLSGSFNLCLDDGSRIEGTYKINVEAKLCLVSILDVADSKYQNTSIRDEDYQNCHTRKSCKPNASSLFDRHIDEDTEKNGISMARIVVDILRSISATHARSKISDNVCPNRRNILHDSVECPNEQTSDYPCPHQKCTVTDDTEGKHNAFSGLDDSNLSCDDLDRNSFNRTNLTGCAHSSGICKKSATNLNDITSYVSSQRNMDITHEIKSKDIHNLDVLTIEKRSRYEENCSTSRETDCSLKTIMDEYDKKFPDEDDEANSCHSRYH